MALSKADIMQMLKDGKIIMRFNKDGQLGYYKKGSTPQIIDTETWQHIVKTVEVKNIREIYFNPDVVYPNDMITKEIWEKIIMKDRIKFMKVMGMN